NTNRPVLVGLLSRKERRGCGGRLIPKMCFSGQWESVSMQKWTAVVSDGHCVHGIPMTDFAADKVFEDEVRRVARQLWPGAEVASAAAVDGRERDGVFETEYVLHLIECTTSRTKEKAESDCEKLDKLARKLAPRDFTKAVKCWFITREEPTSAQRD